MVFGKKSLLIASILLMGFHGPVAAQDTTTENTEATARSEDTATVEGDLPTSDDHEVADLLTDEELNDLVAPIALYPDTLLIQILVAATYPIEVIKANRFVEANSDLEQEALNTAVDAEGWDDSVAVLAQGFQSVLTNMAEHIDWTELAGSAMLAQSDDVMDAVQRMREQADSFGNLETNEQQVVTRDETEAIVIVPADPQVVYVPTYTTSTVYYRHDPLVVFSTGIIIGSIWANNNRWNNYWGCRNCGGWRGGSIHHRPNAGGNRGNGNWNPSKNKKNKARSNISDRKVKGRSGGGKTNRPLNSNKGGRGDNMRRDLSNKSGARDISRPNAGGGDRGRASTGKKATRPSTGGASRNRTPNKANRSTTKRPKASRPSASRQPTKKSSQKRSNSALRSHGGGKASRSSKSRGNASRSRSRGGGGRSRGGGGRRR
jgi:uncharacterized membrane protein YgcG